MKLSVLTNCQSLLVELIDMVDLEGGGVNRRLTIFLLPFQFKA
jgi:hypothetical protein